VCGCEYALAGSPSYDEVPLATCTSHDARECNQALASEQKRGLAGSTNMFGTPATRRAHTSEPTVDKAVRCGMDLLPCTCIKEEACKAPDS
jgi:hypothetical protein